MNGEILTPPFGIFQSPSWRADEKKTKKVTPPFGNFRFPFVEGNRERLRKRRDGAECGERRARFYRGAIIR